MINAMTNAKGLYKTSERSNTPVTTRGCSQFVTPTQKRGGPRDLSRVVDHPTSRAKARVSQAKPTKLRHQTTEPSTSCGGVCESEPTDPAQVKNHGDLHGQWSFTRVVVGLVVEPPKTSCHWPKYHDPYDGPWSL